MDATSPAYQRITGVEVGCSAVPSFESIAGFKSRGVSGLYTEDQALRAILAGIGLSYRDRQHGRSEIIRYEASESVIVQDSTRN